MFKPKLIFSSEDISDYYVHYNTAQPFLIYKTTEFAEPLNQSFNQWSESGELEYLIHYSKFCVIEPYRGWVLNYKNEIIKQSLPYGELEATEKPHYIYYKKKKYLDFSCAVSIRYNWFNYWHFYNDVIGQLYLLEKTNFDKSIPLIVPERALDLAYVREFLRTDFAKNWIWIFQNKETYIRLKSVYLCKSIPNINNQFIFANKILAISNVPHYPRKRIFLQRDRSRGRSIVNIIELVSVLEKYNFEIVDSDAMTLTEQILLFKSAELVIGPHGAGLTNILYRYPDKCSLIELFPADFLPAHYYWLAKELGYNYKAILGSKLNKDGFSIKADDLLKNILELLDPK